MIRTGCFSAHVQLNMVPDGGRRIDDVCVCAKKKGTSHCRSCDYTEIEKGKKKRKTRNDGIEIIEIIARDVPRRIRVAID